jgi:hypothetical protein
LLLRLIENEVSTRRLQAFVTQAARPLPVIAFGNRPYPRQRVAAALTASLLYPFISNNTTW